MKHLVGISTPVSSAEDEYCYYGFPSNPRSIYHTGDPWPRLTGPEAQHIPKQARPVSNHQIVSVWDELGERIQQYLGSVNVEWPSLGATRFAEKNKEPSPVFIWIGVEPGTLSRDDAKVTANYCKRIMAQFQVGDVEVAFRESICTQSAGSRLFDHVPRMDPTANVRGPFTAALGVRIATLSAARPPDTTETRSPYGGTGGLYISEGGDSGRVFLLTARHVALPVAEHSNKLYVYEDGLPRHQIILLGQEAYDAAVEAIENKIAVAQDRIQDYSEFLNYLETKKPPVDSDERLKYERKMADEEELVGTLKDFSIDVDRSWSQVDRRILGHVVYAPPLSYGTDDEKFTEDWALIEFDMDKVDRETFRGNVIDLGTTFKRHQVEQVMDPHIKSRGAFRYPEYGLMPLRAVIQKDELFNPKTLDTDGKKCLVVVKNGNKTGATFGFVGVKSFARQRNASGVKAVSREVAIYSQECRAPFSKAGDSGSMVADADNRILSIITGGAGLNNRIDVTYASPYYRIEERIKAAFPHCSFYKTEARCKVGVSYITIL